MILCEIENNVILSEAMKTITAGEMIGAYKVLIKRLKSAGIKSKIMFLTMNILRSLSTQ